MTSFWPWWLGAAALGTVTLGFHAALRRPLAVSGLYARALGWRAERRTAKLERDEGRLRASLLEATRRRFGDIGLQPETGTGTGTGTGTEMGPEVAPAISASSAFVFVACLGLGGFLASALTGGAVRGASLGPDFDRLLGGGGASLTILLGGGLLVGFGTRMAGGCTSGHGLSGCSRLQPASLVATALFFGTAVLVSCLLSWWLS